MGGDIIENKKTYLYLKALEFANEIDKQELVELFSIQMEDNEAKIAQVKEIFLNSGAAVATQKAIETYTFKAFETLEKMNINLEKKTILRAFGEGLMGRKV